MTSAKQLLLLLFENRAMLDFSELRDGHVQIQLSLKGDRRATCRIMSWESLNKPLADAACGEMLMETFEKLCREAMADQTS